MRLPSIPSPAGASSGLASWRTSEKSGSRPVRTPHRRLHDPGSQPASVVIIGGGGAGLAAAEMLRRTGYDGSLTMLSADDSPPSDRPNLSKDFLAGTAKDDWIPLQSAEFYADNRIDLV